MGPGAALPRLGAAGGNQGAASLLPTASCCKVLAFGGRGTGPGGALLAAPGRRGKFDVSRVPPWRRWPKSGLVRLPLWKLPEVEPPIDILACQDASLVADAICEVVPWKRRWGHHDWLHKVCAQVRRLLPEMEPRDIVRVILAFGELHTKRKPHTLLFHDYETYAQFFQALPLEAATSKTLLPLLRAYRRMDVVHQSWVHSACERVISSEVELEPGDLSELVRLHSHLRIKSPRLFEFVAEVVDTRFAFFSEDNIGDLARSFREMRFHSRLFFDVLQRELPYRLHEYAWWNLIDIAELYLDLEVDDREVIQRIGNETFKLIFSMRDAYVAKALKILAQLEATDSRTFRMLIRSLPRTIHRLNPQVTADALVACAMVKVDPNVIYHRLPGTRLYGMLVRRVLQDIGALSAKMTCDVMGALARAGHRQVELMWAIEGIVDQRPFKFHAEHLVSLLRDFGMLGLKSPGLRGLLLQRGRELPECTPSALCAVPGALAMHRHGVAEAAPGLAADREGTLLTEVSRLLCEPGVYKLPTEARCFRTKDAFWWQQLRQRHFRLRRRKAAAGVTVDPGPPASAAAFSPRVSSAVVHISREECVQLVTGCAQLDWCDGPLLEGITHWLCSGQRHVELRPLEVAQLLDAFSKLGFTHPLMRAALEHALLRVAPELLPADCTRTLRGALDVGMGAHSAAVRALVRRCTSELGLIPAADAGSLCSLSASMRHAVEAELLASTDSSRPPSVRLPIEMHLFSEAVASRFSETAVHRIL